MKDALVKRIERTGSYNGYLPEYNFINLGTEYNHLFDDSSNEEDLYDIFCEIEEECPILVTRTRYEDKLKAIHVTSSDNKDSIIEFGLTIPKNDNIPNLGKGIYCIRDMTHDKYIGKENFGYDGHQNLSEWVCDMNYCFDCDDLDYDDKIRNTMICVVQIDYCGLYDECIFGDDHVGYIVIRQDISPCDIKVETMSIFEFLKKY